MKFVGDRLLLIVLLMLLQTNEELGFRVGRYRVRLTRICKEVDCRWGGWSEWGECNHPCGNAGVQSRNRGHSRESKCGGSSCSGPSTETRPCNRFCVHGTPQIGYCSDCPAVYWGTCCNYPCQTIANCLLLECTTGTNQHCNRCELDYGGEIKAYRLVSRDGYSNRVCEKICSWRRDSTFCYPGNCPNVPSSCRCASGFGGTNCLTINTKPIISYCLITAEVDIGSSIENVEISCADESNPVIYSNIVATTVKIDFKTAFTGPSATIYPYYINDFKVGITAATFDYTLTRESSTGKTTAPSATHNCDPDTSQSNPEISIIDCNHQSTIVNTPLQHADRLHFEASTSNGGYVTINNYDSGAYPSVEAAKYYSGQTTTHKAVLVIDLVKPFHCSVGSTCTENMLDRGPPITKSDSLTMRWSGWSDLLAGIKLYELAVYKLKVFGYKLTHNGEKALVRETLDASTRLYSTTLVDAGVYAVVLTAEDNAGNYQAARRFLIFDNVNVVTITSAENKVLVVNSAAENTSYSWLTSLQNPSNAGDQVGVSWRGHFANEFHTTHKFLNGSGPNSPPIHTGYEEMTGQPPDTVSREAIPNVNGIVKYEVSWAVDHDGGGSLNSPASWVNVNDFQNEEIMLDIPRVDADSMRVWVRATDVMGNTKTDSVLVHVDSSPPIIQDVWLSRHGRTQLAVHHSADLSDLKFEFDSYDFHSGLKEIHWRLHDSVDPDLTHGSGHVAVRRHTGTTQDCVAPQCYCIPKDNECFWRNFEIKPDMSKMDKPHGDHDFDYDLVITSTNNAMLFTVFTYKITVDTTAPHTGVVTDSEQSEPDIDFQQGFTQHASWQGFFDRESGVMFYQYAFSDVCLAANEFTVPATVNVTDTTLTYANRKVSGPETYHCTVVAYNKALEPSKPVCSDGVTVDTTAPEIHEVFIENSWTKDGLVKDSTGNVWYIDRNRFRIMIEQPPVSCRQKARVKTDIPLLYRIRQLRKSSGESNITMCQKPALPDRSTILVSKENMLELSWFGSDDESGIHTYEVGLSSTGSENMDLLSYKSTHGHRHFITYHPDLMDKETFYIHIKAVNRAGQQTVKVIGPVLVEVDAPTFRGDITLSVQQQDEVDYLVAKWDSLSFESNELKDNLLHGMRYAIGHISGTDNVERFASLTQDVTVPGLCSWTEPPTCVATPVNDLHWRLHGRHTYYFTLKLEGVNGLERVVTSEAYEHYIGPPSGGIVVEISVDTTEMLSEDIDHQSSQSRLHITWHGFHHFDQTINYQLAIGTNPGDEDVVGFTDVAGSSRMLSGLTLQPFKNYYASIRASTPDGNTTVSSDGIVILPVGTRLEDVVIYDAMPCSSDKSQTRLSTSHHDFPLPNKSCEVDVDFQSFVSHMGIRWNLPANITTFITNVKWRIQVYDTRMWTEFHEETDAGGVDHVIVTDLHLEPGHTYRTVVQFCHPDGCFLPLYSDGVTVTPDAPVSNGFTSVSLTDTNLTFTWHQFEDPSVPLTASTGAVISRHEWTLLAELDEGHIEYLYPWRLVTQSDIVCAGINDLPNKLLCSYTIRLETPLETSSCLVLALMAYNKASLYSTITRQLSGCDVSSKVTLTVIDAVTTKLNGNILLEKNALWRLPDREYTPSVSTLSAVWPDLRYGTYAWKVVSDRAINRFAFVKPGTAPDYGDFDCSAPEVLACGDTQDNFVNVHDLTLSEGQRYYICILANATDLKFEKFTQHLEQNSDCSNGIVVDTTPPIAGQVLVGRHQSHWRYQIDHSQLNIYWNSFVDVETFGRSSHHSSILKYEYAVGTSPEGVDVRDYVNVGVTNMAVATGLQLQEGHTYYVTVRATDHVGRSTTGTSSGVTIDSTPPAVSEISIDVGSSYITEHKTLSPAWNDVFDDTESGIEKYYWCLGSKPGYCDILSYVETTEPESASRPQDNLQLTDGHPVYVTVQAVNRVGLTAVTTSRAVVVDASPPIAGHVYDVISDGQTTDSDYTTAANEVRAIWSEFHDPHSHITGYSVNIGKCPRCDDILEKSNVGITTDIHLDHVTLELGVTYYTTVEACNGAGLCVTVTSDGVVADTSPPVVGDVFDGLSNKDIEHQSSRTSLSAHWFNFHDPESGLLYMEWRAGTSPGHSDVLSPTRLHVIDKATTTLTEPLPVGKTVYITLKVFNKAGLSSEATSDGFLVDTTAPVTSTQIAHDNRLGMLNENSQVWKSSLSVVWKMLDTESSVVEQFVSLTTRDSIHHNVPAVKLYGDEHEYTFSNVSLADGEIYYAKVIACNSARLCTMSISEGILIDGTPPVTGAYAVKTEHTAALIRHRPGWMIYDDKTLRLAWLGFTDAHCNVTIYYVTVGRKFGSSDLLTGDKPLLITHTTDDQHKDEGFVQKTEVSVTSSIQPNQQMYISIWAENKVGLVSSRLHGTFTAVPSQSTSGTLALERRCQSVTCEGHCTCAPHGHLTCASTGGCVDVKDKPGFQTLSVYDIENYSVNPESNTLDVGFTRTQCTLAATWRTTDVPGKAPDRYEWSVGEDGQSMGGVLLDVLKEPLWRETGQRNIAIYTTGSSKNPDAILEPHKRYKVYVRVWYDANSYSVYSTDGVQTDKTPPELSRANKVTELRSDTSRGDVDFITSTSNVTLSWLGVFRDSHAGIAHYVASVSKSLGGRDLAEQKLTSTVTQTCMSGLTMDTSDMYFTTVVAFNEAGLFRSAYSDGFKVDVTPPVTGHVWDGRGLTDQDYSPDNQTMSAWWRGFSDDESYIDHYEWCVGTAPGKQDAVTCRDVGLHTRSTAGLSSVLSSGTRLYSTVYAVNGAGLKSAGVSSDGVVVDSTPPRPIHRFLFGKNIIKNPSFEEDTLQTVARKRVPKEWTGRGTVYLTSDSHGTTAPEGRQFVDIVSGYLEQTFATVTKAKYRVSFQVHTPDTGRFHSQQLGIIRLPGFHSAFMVQQKVATSSEWQKHVYYFIAGDSSSVVTIGAVDQKTGFLLDNVMVQEVGLGRRILSSDPRDPVNSHDQPMHVHVTSRGRYTAVTAAWDVEDPESPVTSYSWAIGTVRGGLQLQNFRSVGRQTHTRADTLLVQHGTEVHVTLVAENAAGLTKVINSDPLTVDLTPPQLCCLVDGNSEEDISYQTSHALDITWSVKDPESGVKYCEWAIGKSPGSQEVQPFTRMTSLSKASVTLDASVGHGETAFSVVRCFNYAGLQSTLLSNGVVIVTKPPDISMATLNIITSSASYYAARDSHQSDRQRLFFGWEGVRDKSGIAGYEVSIKRTNAKFVLPWRNLPSAKQLFVELQDLGLESYTSYTLMMRATNKAGKTSDVVTKNFTIETEIPQIKNISTRSRWPKKWILNLDWTGVFLSNSSLFYEVNIGTTRGGIDVLTGLETERTTLRITGVDHTKHHYVTLTAVNKAGLYRTSTDIVTYSPPPGTV